MGVMGVNTWIPTQQENRKLNIGNPRKLKIRDTWLLSRRYLQIIGAVSSLLSLDLIGRWSDVLVVNYSVAT